MKQNKSIMLLLAIAVLTATIIVLGMDDIKVALRRVSFFHIMILLLLQLITMVIISYQWYLLLRKKSKSVKFIDVFSVYLSGNFIESVTPSVRIGGEAMKVYLFRQITGLSYHDITGVLVVRKYISILPFLIICGLTLVVSIYLIEVPAMVYVVFLLVSLLFIVIYRLWYEVGRQRKTGILFNSRVPSSLPSSVLSAAFSSTPSWVSQMIPSFCKMITNGKARALNFLQRASVSSSHLMTGTEKFYLMLLSVLVWGLYPVKVFFVGWLLGFSLTPLAAIMGTYIAYLVGMLPLFPGGLGTFEGSMALVFSNYGLSPGEGLAVALIARMGTFWFPLILSAIAAWFMLRKTKIYDYTERKKGCDSQWDVQMMK